MKNIFDKNGKTKNSFSLAFTIIELLIVIVIIGILATISVVSYLGVKDRTIESNIKVQLSGNAKDLVSFRAKYSHFPATIDCTISDSNVNLCLKPGDDVSYTYRVDNKSNPQTFTLYATSLTNGKIYSVTAGIVVTEVSEIPEISTGWKQVSTGSAHTCAIASDNQAYCWGANNYGQLGNNSTTSSSVPVAVDTSGVLSGKTVRSISVGYYYTCAIASDNQAYCWGWNIYGQLGNNSATNSSIPVAVNISGVLSGKTIKAISAGGYATYVIASDDQVYCWGNNSHGQLGNNSYTVSTIPVAVNISGVLSGKTIKAISAGGHHTCAIASDNQAYCWGYNGYGQLGNNSTTDSLVPAVVDISGVLSGKTVKSISAGCYHTCVIASDNQAYCWGYNNSGSLGNNSTTSSSIPAAVDTSGVLNGKTIKNIDSDSASASGNGSTCAIASDNQAYCWGWNIYGQLGNNSTTSSSVPVAVDTSGVLSGKTIISIDIGFDHTCAIVSDNQAYCWGKNGYGQLGNNSTTASLVPVQVIYPSS